MAKKQAKQDTFGAITDYMTQSIRKESRRHEETKRPESRESITKALNKGEINSEGARALREKVQRAEENRFTPEEKRRIISYKD